jgi:DDE superfamily endonuclease
LTGWNAAQLVFIDESAANERNMNRKFGWAPKGLPSHESCPARRSERWSVLPAYTVDGYITYEIAHGSYNAAMFEEFIRQKVLPLCNPPPLPPPLPRSVLIMDNAPIHRKEVQAHQS